MNVISDNDSHTVGIVTDPDKLLHLGTFQPHLLQEWFRKVEQLYGTEQEIHLFIRKSDIKEAYVIFASSNGENPFVAVTGKYPEDEKPWEQNHETSGTGAEASGKKGAGTNRPHK